MQTPTQINQVVMFKEVIDASDAYLTYTIIEIDTTKNWCKIRANIENMNIMPTYPANLSELKVIQ